MKTKETNGNGKGHNEMEMARQMVACALGTLLVTVETVVGKSDDERKALLDEAKALLFLVKGLVIKTAGPEVGAVLTSLLAGTKLEPDGPEIKAVLSKLSPEGQRIVSIYTKVLELYIEAGTLSSGYLDTLFGKKEADEDAAEDVAEDKKKKASASSAPRRFQRVKHQEEPVSKFDEIN